MFAAETDVALPHAVVAGRTCRCGWADMPLTLIMTYAALGRGMTNRNTHTRRRPQYFLCSLSDVAKVKISVYSWAELCVTFGEYEYWAQDAAVRLCNRNC